MDPRHATETPEENIKVLIVTLDGHHFGVHINAIEDVISRLPTTPVPLARPEIIGLLNLRGHIVTEIDIARILNITPKQEAGSSDGYSLVTQYKNESYGFVFETLGDVIDLPKSAIEKIPETVDPDWVGLSDGVFRMDKALVVMLNLKSIIEYLTAGERLAG